MMLQEALDMTPATVKDAMETAEANYQTALSELAAKYKADKKAVRDKKVEQMKRYRLLLDALEAEPEPDYPDATGGHAAVEDATAEEVAAGPSGKETEDDTATNG